MSDTECPTCGEKYKSERGMKIHHTRIHDGNISKTTITCDWCGDEKTKYKSRVDRYNRDYCGSDCRDAMMSQTGSDATNWKGGKSEVECDFCGDSTSVYKWQRQEFENNFCDPSCKGKYMSENQIGENNPNWVDGTTLSWYLMLRRHVTDQVWRNEIDEVIDSDDVCKRCGDSDNLHLHHIIPILSGGTSAEWNYMKLCESCHPSVEECTRSFTEPHLHPENYC